MSTSATEDSVLLELALQFGGTLDLEQLVRLVLDRVVSLLHAERAFFALLDEHQSIKRAVTHNLPWSGPPEPLPASMRAVSEAISTRKPVTSARGVTDPSASQRRLGLNLVVAVPVMVRQQVIGVMYVDSQLQPPQGLASFHKTLLAVASLAGVAVENAQLFHEQRFRQQLLAWMVHEFRNPLTTIIASGDLMKREEGELDALLGREVYAAGRRIEHMIDSTLLLSRLDHAATEPDPVAIDLAAVAREHASGLAVVARNRGVSFDVRADAPHEVCASLDRVELILANLLFNAAKYARPGSVVTVDVRMRPDAGPVEALARPRSEAAILFERLRRFTADASQGFVSVAIANEGEP
ncbi:MAG: GAF domain-containing sensor histidine kinase, partial [Polyangiales bacterium]